MQGQAGGLAARASRWIAVTCGLVLCFEQQQGRSVGEHERVTKLEGGERAWPRAVQAEHPRPDSADPQREREDRPRAGPRRCHGERWPATSGPAGAQV